MRTVTTLVAPCTRSSTASSPQRFGSRSSSISKSAHRVFEAFDFEAELKIVIGKKCCEEVPAALTEKILNALRADGGTQVTF